MNKIYSERQCIKGIQWMNKNDNMRKKTEKKPETRRETLINKQKEVGGKKFDIIKLIQQILLLLEIFISGG